MRTPKGVATRAQRRTGHAAKRFLDGGAAGAARHAAHGHLRAARGATRERMRPRAPHNHFACDAPCRAVRPIARPAERATVPSQRGGAGDSGVTRLERAPPQRCGHAARRKRLRRSQLSLEERKQRRALQRVAAAAARRGPRPHGARPAAPAGPLSGTGSEAPLSRQAHGGGCRAAQLAGNRRAHTPWSALLVWRCTGSGADYCPTKADRARM